MNRLLAIFGWWLFWNVAALAQSPAIQVGDNVLVTADSTKVMSGSDQIGTLVKGTKFTVEKISGSWLQGSLTIEGQKRSGWVHGRDVVAVKSSTTDQPKSLSGPARRPQIELDPWDRPFVLSRRSELEIKAGDTIVVANKDGTPLYQPDGQPLYLTKDDYKQGKQFIIPQGTRLTVREVDQRYGGDSTYYHVTIEAEGKKWNGYLFAWEIVKLNRYQAAGGKLEPRVLDSTWYQQNFQRNLPRLDLNHDIPATLYGTTPVKQGLFRRVTVDLNSPNLQQEVGSTSYLNRASEDRDVSTRREPGTERLLAGLPQTPDWSAFFERVGQEIARSVEQAAKQDEAELTSLRAATANLRANGQYDAAAESATTLVEKSRAAMGDEHWRTREARVLQQTLDKIRSLKGDARREITEADGANRTLVRERDDSLKAFLLAVDQHVVRRDHLGADHPDTLASRGWLAFLLRGGSGQDVESLSLELVEGSRKVFSDSHPWTARAISNLAIVRLDRADQIAGVRLLAYAVDLLSEHQQLVTPDGVLILANLGRALEQAANQEASQRAFTLSRTVARALSPQDRQQVVAQYMAEVALLDQEAASQFPLLLRMGLAYRPELTNNITPRLMKRFGIWTGGTKAGVPRTQTLDSLSFARIGQTSGTKVDPISDLISAASQTLVTGDISVMERVYREAYRLLKTQEDSAGIWQTVVRNGLARVLSMTGNVEEAVRYQMEAVALQRRKWEIEYEEIKKKQKLPREERFGGTTFELYSLYYNLAQLGEMYERMGKLSEAEKSYREAIEMRLLKKRIEDPELWSPLTSFKFDDLYSKDSDDLANLARVQALQGDLAGAEKTFRQALAAIFSTWALQANQNQSKTLASCADVLMQRGGSPSEFAPMAYDAWANAMRMESRAGMGVFLAGMQPAVVLAEVLRKSGRLAEAALILRQGIASVDQMRSKTVGDELSRSQFFTELTRFNPYSLMARVQIEAGENYADSLGDERYGPRVAFDLVEAGRGRALLDLTSRRGGDPGEMAMEAAIKRNDAALKTRVESLRDQQRQARETLTRLASQAAPTSPLAIQTQVTQINSAREADRQAARDLFDIARTIMEDSARKPLNSDEAAELLRKNEVLLVYDIGPRDSVLLTVTPSGIVEGHFLVWPDGKPVTQETLNVSVAEFFEEISRETSEANNSTTQVEVHDPEELARAILPDKVRTLLGKSQKAFLVADGALHRLPFESLFLDADGDKVLLDEAPAFVYGSSATIMLSERDEQTNRPKHGTDLVALGDAKFSRGDEPTTSESSGPVDAPSLSRTRALNRFGQLSPLPGTRAEINTIVSRWPKSGSDATAPRVLLGNDATVGNLMKAVEHPRFLHLATHGLAEGGRKAHESALAFAAPSTVSLTDNGFLTLADMLERWGEKLNGTEMVVLSACRTARGEMSSGDGFVALTWGFLYAGTRCVVASLWEVDDTATALLMSRLYENVLGSFESPRTASGKTFAPGQPLPKAEALREAKQWLRHLSKSDADKLVQNALGEKAQAPKGDRPFADPYYWAAFVLVGNGD